MILHYSCKVPVEQHPLFRICAEYGMLFLALSCAPSNQLTPRASVFMSDVTVRFPGGKSATVPVGSPLSLAAYKAGAQITYQCKAGTCASCEVKLGGKNVRTCQTTVEKPWFGDSVTVTAKPGSATRL